MVHNQPAKAGGTGSIPGSGSSPGGGNGNPLQYSCLGNSTEEPCGPWGCKESDTTEHTHTHIIHFLMWVRVKAMALAELPPSSKNRLISIRSID